MIGIAKTGSGKTIAFGVPSVVHALGMRELFCALSLSDGFIKATSSALCCGCCFNCIQYLVCTLFSLHVLYFGRYRLCTYIFCRALPDLWLPTLPKTDQAPVTRKAHERGPIVLVLSPTRELAMQTAEVYNKIALNTGIVWCVYILVDVMSVALQ